MSNSIILSIIIPNHNSAKTIRNLLLSINHSKFYCFKQIEIVIVDDLSTDDSLKIIYSMKPKLKYILGVINPGIKIGPAKARNVGVKQAKGKYILFLDSDVQLDKNTLNHVFIIAKEHKILAFTGIWDYHQRTNHFFPQYKALRDWSYWLFEREFNSHYYLFSTRIAGIEKKLFEKIGGFSEFYDEPTVEDIDLTYKIEKVASIQFIKNLVVKHEFEDFFPIAIKYFKRSRDWIKLYRKRFRFDPVATSKTEAIKSIIVGLSVICLLLSFFSILLTFVSLMLFLVYTYFEINFWRFIIQKKGYIFWLKSIPTSIILYLIIDLGTFYGLVQSLLPQFFNKN